MGLPETRGLTELDWKLRGEFRRGAERIDRTPGVREHSAQGSRERRQGILRDGPEPTDPVSRSVHGVDDARTSLHARRLSLRPAHADSAAFVLRREVPSAAAPASVAFGLPPACDW